MLVIYHNLSNRPQKTYRPTHSRKSPEKRDFVVHTHIVKPKKDIMASNPRNLTISGVFLAFPRFFATMGFADTECRKKDIISKKRLPAGC